MCVCVREIEKGGRLERKGDIACVHYLNFTWLISFFGQRMGKQTETALDVHTNWL